MIDVDVRFLMLSEAVSAAPVSEHAGIVARVGSNFKVLVPDDRIVALSPVVCTNRLRIPHDHAGRIS